MVEGSKKSDVDEPTLSRRGVLQTAGSVAIGTLALPTIALESDASSSRNDPPDVIMGPTPQHPQWKHLVDHPGQWRFLQQYLDGIELFGWNLAPQVNGGEPIEGRRLDRICHLANRHNLSINVSRGPVAGGGSWNTKAERAANKTNAIFDAINDGGGQVSHLNVDGPMRYLWRGARRHAGKGGGIAGLDNAIDELIQFMRRLHQQRDHLTFSLLVNFPNWGWKQESSPPTSKGSGNGNYYPAFDRMIDRIRADTNLPLTGVRADCPAGYDIVDDLVDLSKETHARQLEFEMILNSGPQFNNGPNKKYVDRTRKYLDTLQREGLDADRYVVQNWWPRPSRAAPEGHRNTTAGLTKWVIQRTNAHRDGADSRVTTPLYRVYRPNVHDHFYTTNAGAANWLTSNGAKDEGVEAVIYSKRVRGTHPLFRLHNPQTGSHYYTTNLHHRRQKMNNGWHSICAEGYVFTTQKPGTVPLHYLLHRGSGDHFYTTSEVDPGQAQNNGYEYRGVTAYVWPAYGY